MSAFFKIENVSCGYSDKFRLKNINFELERGTFAGIIGPNGSGKTTLFRGITGELINETGLMELDNKNIIGVGGKIIAQNIAVVSQDIDSIDITVEDYVLMGRIPHRRTLQFFETPEDYELAYRYMKLTDIFHLKDKNISKLSGGEQQLASIARALTQQPVLLLLDEPTSHLDITHQVQILNLVQQLNSDFGLTVLMIIHDLNLAGEYCDYLIMMNNGEIHVKGTPEEVLNYKNIEDVYKTVVVTRTNPMSRKPAIFLISNKILKQNTLNKN